MCLFQNAKLNVTEEIHSAEGVAARDQDVLRNNLCLSLSLSLSLLLLHCCSLLLPLDAMILSAVCDVAFLTYFLVAFLNFHCRCSICDLIVGIFFYDSPSYIKSLDVSCDDDISR